ncbi:MAG: fructosamine kinase family protein [Gammaproteobacteria bacterium]|nr:fructosamine kinase family protein [Sideroxydans sp.]MBU3904114.1 fructosamine kinase family protein [Gammaproteobacteria bacterium]MBU4046827.1 fructosamine kinase family protein [Gammaproteobacteria bacterium]
MKLTSAASSSIVQATQRPFLLQRATPVGGGDINQAFRLEGTDGSRYFLKLNEARQHATFISEAAGLQTIAATQTLRVPQVIAHGASEGMSFLVMEHLQLGGKGNARRLGEQLAALHRHRADRFGFPQDNFIGTTPQPNDWAVDWLDFWREQRLGHQLRLAAQNGYGGELHKLGEKLMDALPELIAGYSPQPSLLHGDLWGGNHGFLADGTPTVFDPACYYGDRECDLAMTELFGGYPADFYAAYQAEYPLDAGYARRRELYNLYHILNHANLFGGGYAGQAGNMISALLAP